MTKIILGGIAFIFGMFTVIGYFLFTLFWYALVVAFLIEFIWNRTLVPLTHVTEIGYWQSVGLYILTGVLFRIHTKTEVETKKKPKF